MSFKKYMLWTSAHAVVAVETGITPDKVDELSQWLLRKGWKSFLEPAIPSGGPATSGGVAICVRAIYGLRAPSRIKPTIVPNRVLCAVVDAPGWHDLKLIGGYLVSGKGLNSPNAGYLADIGAAITAEGGHFALGADWNMTPEVVASTGLHRQVNGVLITPKPGQVTCTTANGSSQIDCWLTSERVSRCLDTFEVLRRAPVSTHKPTRLTFHPGASQLHAWTFQGLQRLPVEVPFGPRPRPLSWTSSQAAAEHALVYARKADGDQAIAALDRAYEIFASDAEASISCVTGVEMKAIGKGGKQPTMQWLPVLDRRPEPYGGDAEPTVQGWKELIGAAKELRSVMVEARRSKTQLAVARAVTVAGEVTNAVPEAFGLSVELEQQHVRLARAGRIAASHAAVLDTPSSDELDDWEKLDPIERSQKTYILYTYLNGRTSLSGFCNHHSSRGNTRLFLACC